MKKLISSFYSDISSISVNGSIDGDVLQTRADKTLRQLFEPYIEYNDLIAGAFHDIVSVFGDLDTRDIFKEIDDRSTKFYESQPETTEAGKQRARKNTSYNKEMRDFVRTYNNKRNL